MEFKATAVVQRKWPESKAGFVGRIRALPRSAGFQHGVMVQTQTGTRRAGGRRSTKMKVGAVKMRPFRSRHFRGLASPQNVA
jgi:hypothetical protein